MGLLLQNQKKLLSNLCAFNLKNSLLEGQIIFIRKINQLMNESTRFLPTNFNESLILKRLQLFFNVK